MLILRPSNSGLMRLINIQKCRSSTKLDHCGLLELQVLLDLRVLFEGGPYMRKYGSKVSRPLIEKSMRVAIATQASSLSAN